MNRVTSGSRVIVVALLGSMAAACGHTAQPAGVETRVPRAADGVIAITGVTLVDVVSGATTGPVVVVTRDGRIAEIGAGIAAPPDAVRVDGSGRFLIPGLWDMHAHHQGTGAASLDLYLANGVVGTRDMGADLDFILPLRDRINRGDLSGPEIVAAGPILDDRPRDWPFRRRVTNASEAREAVRDLHHHGVDFLKVHDGTPREAFFAIADEARRLGLPFAGHVPFAVTIEEAAQSGMRSIEHLANLRVSQDCSAASPQEASSPQDHATPCSVRYATLASRGVYQTPTMAFFHELPDLFSGAPLPHADYASDALLDLTRRNAAASALDARALASLRSRAASSLAVVRALLETGNGLLAGCDGLVPGFCLHDELEWMVRAGLSPIDALRTATINPARFLGREKTSGSIAIGKRADLVLLDADPRSDIGNVRRISAVVVRGRLLSKASLDGILAAHRRTAPPR